MQQEILVSGAVGMAFSVLGQLIFYFLFSRRDDVRDRKYKDLEEEVSELKETRLTKIEADLQRSDDKRGALYTRMEEQLVSRRECVKQHEETQRMFDELSKRLGGMQVGFGDSNTKLARVEAVVMLIASHLNINIGTHGDHDR